MGGWKKEKLGNLLELVYGKSLPKTKRTDGNIPVYGSNGIVGFHCEAIVNEPGIIVGRKGSAGNIHFSKVPFCPIDTTFYITQQHSKLELDFLYYALDFLDLKRILGDVGVPGLNREMAYLEELFYPLDKAEQRKIAHVLITVKKAIEQQDNLIRTTTELKKALMQKLFTEGTKGEKQKETEIGLVPESWEVVRIGDIFKFSSGKSRPNNTTKERTEELNIPVYGGNGILGYTDQIFQNRITLILGRVGEYCGCAHLTEEKSWISDNALYSKEQIKDVDLFFIRSCFEFLNLNQYSNKMGQPLITQGIINNVKFGLPQMKEQAEIAHNILSIDNKIENLSKKKQTLTSLFKTLLHELMTGQRRVHEMDFETCESQTSL